MALEEDYSTGMGAGVDGRFVRVYSVNYVCRFRQLFLPVYLLFPTPLLSHSSAIAGDVEWEKTRLEVMPKDRRS